MSFNRVPLLWRVFAINAALLIAATLVLAFSSITIHASIALAEGIELLIGLMVILTANLVLLRPTFAPLDRLVRRMQTVDLLRPGQRLPESGGPQIVKLVRAFNEMLDRLELERHESGKRALAAQEAERMRIAGGLHDEVGQVLTGVLLHLDSLAGQGSPEHAREVAETKQAVRQALEEVRRIAQELRPEMLEHLGLVSAITELSNKFSTATGIAVDRRFTATLPRLSPEVELAVYRVAQESLTNIVRHADASRVEVSLQCGTGSVILRIADDGHGFDEAHSMNGHGGLRGMRERALLVGGALAIRSPRDGGVEIRLEVPAGES